MLVHDAARLGLPADALARLIDACLADAAGGLLALPVADTVKAQGDAGPHAGAHGGPRRPVAGADPQMFRAGPLRDALAGAAARGLAITDEAGAMEAAGHAPRLVPGDARNFKVTWPGDFALMEKWL